MPGGHQLYKTDTDKSLVLRGVYGDPNQLSIPAHTPLRHMSGPSESTGLSTLPEMHMHSPP